MEEQNTEQPKEQKRSGERSPLTTSVLVLVAIVLILLGVFFFTRSDKEDLENIAPSVSQ